MQRFKHIKTLVLITFGSMAVVLAWAVQSHSKNQPAPLKKASGQGKERPLIYDPALLARFQHLTAELNFNKKHCTYAGSIDMTDPADSTNTATGIGFLFSRSGDDYYYKLGNTETIHRDGLNIFIRHDQRKVVVSKQDISVHAPVGSTMLIEKNLRDEHYTLTEKKSGASKTLTILNERHLACKELTMTYDTVSGKLQKIYARLTDPGNFLNKNRDRVTQVWISRMEETDVLAAYPSVNDVVRRAGEQWALAPAYANYELIIL